LLSTGSSFGTQIATAAFPNGFQAHQKAVTFNSEEQPAMKFRVEIEQEEDGRWIAEVIDLPGVLAYGNSPEEARAKVQALALRVVADRLEHGEVGSDLVTVSFAAA
jgi:predicted RNase H-like HicB family nuclease